MKTPNFADVLLQEQPEYLLRFRGLDAGRRYRVTFDNRGQTFEIDGFTVMHQGMAGTAYETWLRVQDAPLPVTFASDNPLRTQRGQHLKED